MLRWFEVDVACDVDFGLYEVYPIGRVFSFYVHSEVEIFPGDFVLVDFNIYYTRVIKLVRNGEVVIDVRA